VPPGPKFSNKMKNKNRHGPKVEVFHRALPTHSQGFVRIKSSMGSKNREAETPAPSSVELPGSTGLTFGWLALTTALVVIPTIAGTPRASFDKIGPPEAPPNVAALICYLPVFKSKRASTLALLLPI
jgi:hypothetical protein